MSHVLSPKAKFSAGQTVYINKEGFPHKSTIREVDFVDGVYKYWLHEYFLGYYDESALFATKNEAIDAFIRVLNRMRDE